MTTRTLVSAAAPAWVAALVAGPEEAARVVHRGADAVYLDVGGSCVGVLSAAAVAVPCAVRTGLAALATDLPCGGAIVGGGRISLGHSDVVVTRAVDTAVPRLPHHVVSSAAARMATAVRDGPDSARAELPATALEDLAGAHTRAVRALLGRGSGLTPLGDDVLAGWVATTVAAGPSDEAAAVRAVVVRLAPRRTTVLSATLLACAARGDVLPQLRTLLQDLADPTGRVDGSVADLLRVGHSSGAGLVLGTALALRHLASRST